ncbi:MAG: hypothetical protein WA813_21375 [Beijerinckiaceae bacterium]
MNAKASDPHDLYLHLRARAFRLEIAIFTEQCCAGDDTVYGNGQKYRPLSDTEYEALQADLERVEVEIKEIERDMRAVELISADTDAEIIQEQISNYWENGPRPGQTLEN